MHILIKKDAALLHSILFERAQGRWVIEYRLRLAEIAGQWVMVDTEMDNQYKIKNGMIIHKKLVEKVG